MSQFAGTSGAFSSKQKCVETLVTRCINVHNFKISAGQEIDKEWRSKLITAQNHLSKNEIDEAFNLFKADIEIETVDAIEARNPLQEIL